LSDGLFSTLRLQLSWTCEFCRNLFANLELNRPNETQLKKRQNLAQMMSAKSQQVHQINQKVFESEGI